MLKGRTIVIPTVLTAALVAGGAGTVLAGTPEDVAALKDQVTQLQARIQELEHQLAQKQGVKPHHLPVPDQNDLDPFLQMESMDRQMQALMAQPLWGGGMMARAIPRGHGVSFDPDYDLKAADKAYTISFDMPGMDKAKINVEVKDGVILVSGERSSETKEDQGGKFYRQERSFGYFSRSIPLPEDAKPETVQAKYDNGVLTISLERKIETKKGPLQPKIEVK